VPRRYFPVNLELQPSWWQYKVCETDDGVSLSTDGVDGGIPWEGVAYPLADRNSFLDLLNAQHTLVTCSC
jgi:hypothetical protein